MYKKVTGNISTQDSSFLTPSPRPRYGSGSSSSFTYHPQPRRSFNSSTTLSSVCLYFPPNWDALFHEVYYDDKEKEEAYQEVLSGLALSIASDILNKSDETPIQQTWLASRAIDSHNAISTRVEAYIHRVSVEQQDSGIVYRLLCCNKDRMFTHLVNKDSMPNINISDYHSKAIHFSSERHIDAATFHQEYGMLPSHLQLEVNRATQVLEETMQSDTHLQFIHHKSKQSNMRIAEPLIYPKLVRADILTKPIYEAILPRIYEKFTELPAHLEKFLALIEEIYVNIEKMSDKDQIQSLLSNAQYYKDNVFIAKVNIDSIKKPIEEIVVKKTHQQNTLQTLKARMIWAIHESIREHYLSMIYKSKDQKNPQEFVNEFNRLFSPSVEINDLLRLKFKNLSHYSIDEIFNDYNRVLGNSYRQSPPTLNESENFFKKNMARVNKDLINDVHYFDFNSMGYLIKNKNYYELLEKSNLNIIKPYYEEESKKIQDNLKLLSDFIDFSYCEKLKPQESKQFIDERMRSIEAELIQLKMTSAKILECGTVVDPAIAANNAHEKAEVNDSDKRVQALIDLIHNILSDNMWWHIQIKGFCPGTKIADITVPHGIYQMAIIQQTRLHESPTDLLRHYQAVARERLKFYIRASLFPIRMQATTSFYQLLTHLDIHGLTDHNLKNFMDFQVHTMSKPNPLIKNDLPSTTVQTYSEPPSPMDPQTS